MEYTIAYYSESVQEQILDLPDTLAARFIVLTRRMVAIGPNLERLCLSLKLPTLV